MKRSAICALVVVAACGQRDPSSATAAGGPLPPPDPKDGFQMKFAVTSEPHSETYKCLIGTLPVGGIQNVKRVTHAQSKSMHHMDLMVILNSGLDKPPGVYDCAPLYTEFPRLMDETILYASQSATGEIDLPEGVVARVPGSVTVLYEIHHVNTTDAPEELFSTINVYTTSADNVRDTIYGGAIRDRNINIPPRSDMVEWTRCVMNEDIDLLFLSTHTHELGRDTRVFKFDGKSTGEEIYVNTDWQTPILKKFEKPLHVKKGEGFEFRCHFVSPRDKVTSWGLSAQDEMCQIGIVHTPGSPGIKCDPVETSDGVILP